ncbi:uncharacterized protein AB9W97_006047 [Spinachia spinachia]
MKDLESDIVELEQLKPGWTSAAAPGLTGTLVRRRVLCLQQLVDAVGPTLNDAPALGSLLGLHSLRVARRLLEMWNQRLTVGEKSLLQSYRPGGVEPDPADPFPEIYLSPGQGDLAVQYKSKTLARF